MCRLVRIAAMMPSTLCQQAKMGVQLLPFLEAQMRNIPLRRRMLPVGLLTFLAVGGLIRDARSQDSTSPQSPKPATEPKLILEVAQRTCAVWMDGGCSLPWVLLRVYSDRSAPFTKEQYDKLRAFLDQPELIAQKNKSCGNGGGDSSVNRNITLHRGEQQQSFDLINFSPGLGPPPQWPAGCPKIIVQLQCTIEELLDELHGKTTHWKKDCEDILAK
jgi:hypothetical protein